MSVMNATEPVYVNETKVVTCDIGYMFQELGSRTQEVLCQMNYTTGEAQYNNDIGVCEGMTIYFCLYALTGYFPKPNPSFLILDERTGLGRN